MKILVRYRAARRDADTLHFYINRISSNKENRIMRTQSILLASAMALGIQACSSTEKRPADTPSADTQIAAIREVAAPRVDASESGPSQIEVAESIRRACGLTITEAYFAFDSSALGAKGRTSLDKIATCFIGGPLAGRNLSLVGHADPRGDDEYNLLLGDRRAQTVSRALSSRGVPLAQLSATSRGEMDALGTNEMSWGQDRRVSLDLAK